MTPFILVAALVPSADPPRATADKAVNELLAPVREKYKIPGLIGAFVKGDKVVAIGAVGVRKSGSAEPMTVNDKMHLGSCTKAMTATVIASLVEEKKLAWDTTLGQAFSDKKDKIHPDYRDVTLTQLLTHRAGLPANTLWGLLGRDDPVTDQREKVLNLLEKEPQSKPGSKFEYSNVGYVIAGRMAERAAKKPWEDLMRERLFDPLGMKSAGFGVPGDKEKVDQPWGHTLSDGKFTPDRLDNPPVIGPAGTVHCSLPDWAKFAALHERGAKMLKPATFRVLHTPPEKADYACGWNTVDRDWAGGTVLTHGGSNGSWKAVVWVAPKRQFAVLVATNSGGGKSEEACDDAVTELLMMYAK
jgi:CubicO group peptidase (beta-lactamase class C family)